MTTLDRGYTLRPIGYGARYPPKMRPLLPLALFGLALSSPLFSQRQPLGPDSQPRAGVPKGAVTKHELPPGRLYPGTPHDYWVYVPAQYNPAKPTPLMIFMDGHSSVGESQRVPVVFDNLIARGDLPPLIGIFVDPGVLPASAPQSQSRFERIFEYDSLSPRFSEFLLTELIPAVAKSYNLSTDPNDRALSGTSTGAVAAFVAAWNRPDQFRRVLSYIGTFVAMKGADSLPALIRKNEPKPLRVFLEDGKQDHIAAAEPFGTFYAGSWPINNQVMFEALEYAGYDVRLVLHDGAHSMDDGGAAMMPEALRWLWRDYPHPIVARAPAAMSQPGWDPRGKPYSIVSPEKDWSVVAPGPGPLAAAPDGSVYYATAGTIYRIEPGGRAAPFHLNAGFVTALAVTPEGRVFAARRDHRDIVAYDASRNEQTIARDLDAGGFAVTAKGAVYFTDITNRTVGLMDPDGRVRTVYSAGEIAVPAGLALSADQAMLVVSDAQSRYSWSFQIAQDGALVNGEPFYRLEMQEETPGRPWASGAVQAAEDTVGQVYFATPIGIQMCEANGRVATILNSPVPGHAVDAMAFAGDSLYVVSNGRIFRRPVKVKGAEAWNVVRLPKPPL